MRRPATVWPALFALTGGLLALLPIYNLFATRWNAATSLAVGDLLALGVDLTLVTFAIAYLYLARRVARYRPPVRAPRRARAAVARAPDIQEATA